MTHEAYIFDAIRTPRGKGKKDGSLHEVPPIGLLTALLKALHTRHGLDTAQVEDVIIGCVMPVGDQGADIARCAVLDAGWNETVAGVQINRFCSSGLEAIGMAAEKVRSGWYDLLVAGGVERGRSPEAIPLASLRLLRRAVALLAMTNPRRNSAEMC
jgi:acetyl-CoA C-acetyltransferase